MKTRWVVVLAAGLWLFVHGAPPASASGQEPSTAPAYSNVEVVSIDAATRLVVVKDAKGTRETLELDDSLAGTAGVRAGDRVMMTVRGEPGRKRISAITKLTASVPSIGTTISTPSGPTSDDLERVAMRERFGDQVAALSQQARSIDAVWSSFVNSCDVKQDSSATGGREWFGLWDGRVKADLSSGFCRDLFNQIVSPGESIKKGMAAAEDVARKTLSEGEVRDIRKLNSMDWDGWALPAPDRRDP